MQRGSVSFATVITRVHTYLSKVVYLILLLKIYTYWRSDFPVRNFAVQWTTIYVRVTKYRIAQKTVNQTHSDRNFDANKVRPANVYSSTLDLKLCSACRTNFRGGGVIAKLRKATISFVMTICQCVSVCVCVCVCVCGSVRPHATTRLPLDGFSWNSTYFSKICRQNSSFIKTVITGTLHEQQYTGGPPYPWVMRSKNYRGYVKPQIIPNAIYNVT